MSLPSLKICRRIRQLFRSIGDPNANAAATAREKLVALLAKYALSWNDIPACIAEADADDARRAPKPTVPPAAAGSGPEVNVLDLVLDLLAEYFVLTDAQRMAAALWILHTYVFDRFAVTPRLALLSPVRGCGKTTLMVLLELLAANADRSDSMTAAWIYHTLDERSGTTLLADEADNLGLLQDPVLRAVFNSGHRRGGWINRYIGGRPRKYPTFAPLAVAAIGMLPLPLLHRSIIVEMRRLAPNERVQLLNEADAAFSAVRREFGKWAAICNLAPSPAIPERLRARAADNWRVLLAIADDLGHGEVARAAAIELAAGRPDEDPAVTLLTHIRTVLNEMCTVGDGDIPSKQLVGALCARDDWPWHDWRGPRDDRTPHSLTQGELAQLLRPFGIRPGTVWPKPRRSDSRSSRGYSRKQFEQAWAAYCDADDTTTQPREISHLRVVPGDT